MKKVTSEYIALEVANSLSQELKDPSIKEKVNLELIRKGSAEYRKKVSEEAIELALAISIAGAIIQVASFTIQVLDYISRLNQNNESEDRILVKLEIKRKIDIKIIQDIDPEILDKIIDSSIAIAKSGIQNEE